jgi:hypothetical protein
VEVNLATQCTKDALAFFHAFTAALSSSESAAHAVTHQQVGEGRRCMGSSRRSFEVEGERMK